MATIQISIPEANGRYRRLHDYLQGRCSRILIRDGRTLKTLLFEDVAERLAEVCPVGTTLNLLPLMSVAGDHALNDMAGDEEEDTPLEEQSGRSAQGLGYKIEAENCHLHGLADLCLPPSGMA